MTDGSFMSGAGATAVHEKPTPVLSAGAKRQAFTEEARRHLSVIGQGALLEKLSSSHRYATLRGTPSFSPTEELFTAYAESAGWDGLLTALADVLRDAREARRV